MRKFFQEILGLEGSKIFLGKFRQVHNLKISDRLLRSKSFFQENIPGFICSVFRSARGADGVPYQNKTSLGLVFSPTAGLDSQRANLLLTDVGKIEGEREVQQACGCCVREKTCTTVAAAQFGVYAVYVCATQFSLMMHSG